MLTITDTLDFTHKVQVRVPVDGGHASQEFSARFRACDIDELRDLAPEDQLRRVWIGWDGVVTPEGQPVPFSDAARDHLIGMLFVRTAVLRTYAEAIAGAARGN